MNAQCERIAFVLPNLSGGGAASVATILTREWAEMGHDVHLITFEHPGWASIYPVDERITRHQIGLARSPRNLAGFVLSNLQRVRRLRREFKSIQPSIIISFLLDANVATVLAGGPLAAPVLLSERNHPGHDKINAIKARIRAAAYRRADILCVQTEDIRQWYADHLGLAAAVIPNPAPKHRKPGAPADPTPKMGGRYRAIGLGRLEPQKGYDRLIEAFAMLKDRALEWDLTIFGEGGERPKLESLIAKHGLEQRVSLPGVTTAPERELNRADLFVHASRYEGFPNALIEALCAGLCVVATDCPGATGELLKGGEFGILAPDEGAEALANAMLTAMTDHNARCRYAALAAQALAPLTPRAIAQRWLDEARRSQIGPAKAA